MHFAALGRAVKKISRTVSVRNPANKEKRGVPRLHEKTCCLGTPFPRSALFLETSLWETYHVAQQYGSSVAIGNLALPN
jgi:hypothetical protein